VEEQEAIQIFDQILLKYRNLEDPKRAGYVFKVSVHTYHNLSVKSHQGFLITYTLIENDRVLFEQP
jgi:hypothetical protein